MSKIEHNEALNFPPPERDDFARSIDEAYAVIRERVAAGGEPWRPKWER